MRILVYSDYTRINHSVRPEAEIFLQLAARGHRICIFSPQLDPGEPFTKAGIRTATTGSTAKISLSAIRLLRDELRRDSYDIVFATGSRTIPTAAFACLGFDCKLVVYRGTTRGLKWRDITSFLTVLHPRVDAVATVSEAVSDAVRKKLYKNRDKVVSIFKGHNIDWYTDHPADLTEFGIPSGAVVAIAVARFRPSKGLRYLLEASDLLADIDALHLLIVGSGTDREPYRSLINRSAMADRIHLTGRREDALSLIAAADFLVQPSSAGEGLPRSIIEALAFGKPVISTTVGGAREVLEEGKSGLMIPPADSRAIADSVRALAEDPERTDAMSAHCRNLLRTRLSHMETAVAYEAFFQSLCCDRTHHYVETVRDEVRHLGVAAGYVAKKSDVLKLLDDFETQGEVLYQKRNTVKKMQVNEAAFVVKSYRVPTGINSFVYARFRKTKARRSFEHAERLLALAIETPAPVAYLERKRRGLLRESYLISEYYPHDFSMSHVLADEKAGSRPEAADSVVEAFIRFTFQLHEAGVLHRDHNAGNTLVRRQGRGWSFAIIDINRMQFGPLGMEQRIGNLVRLTDDEATMRLMARTYAGLANESPEDCERRLLALKRKHRQKLEMKKRFKAVVGRGAR